MLSDDTMITTVEGLQLIEGPDGTVVGQTPADVFDLGDLRRDLISPVVDACRAPTPFAEVVARSGLPAVDVAAIVEGLWGLVFIAPPAPTKDLSGPVIVHGNGRLARTIVEHLRRLGCNATADLSVPDTAAYDLAVIIAPSARPGSVSVNVEGAGLHVIAHERLATGAIADLAANRPSLTVVPQPGAVLVGGCPVSAVGRRRFGPDTRSWHLVSRFRSAALSDSVGAEILAASAAREVIAVLRGAVDRDDIVELSATGEHDERPAPHAEDCSWCAPLSPAADAAMAIEMDRAAPARVAEPARTIRSVVVLGGGTAGYLTALGLRRRCPELVVTLVESSGLGTIGVGEATTPRLVRFLHSPDGLGLDIAEFHERVRPVWKLGVLYDWAPPDRTPFAWPFEFGDLRHAMAYDGHTDNHCLGSALMERGRVPLVDVGGDRLRSLMVDVPFAYHLDNTGFVEYLRGAAERCGVTVVEGTVERVGVDPAGSVTQLVLADGGSHHADLYVDCSGFRSRLLGQETGTRWQPYDSSLYCDRAVIGDVGHDGFVRPYTEAETLDAGWCWRIAFDDQDHKGYVYSSAALSDDAAETEFRQGNPGLGDTRTIRFQSGRHEVWWNGNVVALGNAYGFVEPLASTALHLLVGMIDLLCASLPHDPGPLARTQLSATVANSWDRVHDWLATQYRHNHRRDTDFWRACRSEVSLGSAEARVARFAERAPLAAGPTAEGYFGEDYSYDIILAGQGVEANWLPPVMPAEAWRTHVARLHRTADRSLTMGQARTAVARQPKLLYALVDHPDGWISNQRY